MRAPHGAHRARPPARLAHRARARQLAARHGARTRGRDPRRRGRRPAGVRVQAARQLPPRRCCGRLSSCSTRSSRSTSSRAPTPRSPPPVSRPRRRPARSPHRCCCGAAHACGSRSTGPPRRWLTRATPPMRGRELAVRHAASPRWRIDAVEALGALGDVGEARRLACEQLALAERLGLPGRSRRRLRALARTADRAERDPAARTRRRRCSPSHPPGSSTRGRSSTSVRRCAAPTGAPTPARRCGAALDLAERTGMLLLARRARDELHAAGARPGAPRSAAPRAHGRRAPRRALAAEGHSNREIAEQLYVTQRTVETHLTHAFQKLDISSRGELAGALEPSLADDRAGAGALTRRSPERPGSRPHPRPTPASSAVLPHSWHEVGTATC